MKHNLLLRSIMLSLFNLQHYNLKRSHYYGGQLRWSRCSYRRKSRKWGVASWQAQCSSIRTMLQLQWLLSRNRIWACPTLSYSPALAPKMNELSGHRWCRYPRWRFKCLRGGGGCVQIEVLRFQIVNNHDVSEWVSEWVYMHYFVTRTVYVIVIIMSECNFL